MAIEAVLGVRPPLIVGREAMKVLEALFVSKAELGGVDNINLIRSRLLEGKHIILVANHLSHLDGAAIDLAFRWNGFSDLAGRYVYLSGLRMEKQFFTRILGKCVPTIPVWPPTENPKNDEELKERNKMVRDSLRTVKNVLNGGGIPVIFPEGGRSRTVAMRQGFSAVAGYFSLVDNVLVVPVGIVGTDKILPVGSGRPARKPIVVNVGTPMDIKALEESFQGVVHQERKQKVVDSVMFAIADLLPDSYKGMYRR